MKVVLTKERIRFLLGNDVGQHSTSEVLVIEKFTGRRGSQLDAERTCNCGIHGILVLSCRVRCFNYVFTYSLVHQQV